MIRQLARTSITNVQRVRTMATPRRSPPVAADFVQKNWMSDPGTFPIIAVVAVACSISCYKMFHDARSPEAHFSKSERTSLDYIENERTEEAAKNWTSHRTLHKSAWTGFGPSYHFEFYIQRK